MSELVSFPKPPDPKVSKGYFVKSLGQTKLTFDWFVGTDTSENGTRAFVARPGCTVQPLVNGAEAFGELEAAIQGATQTIDYVTWGFDPSMRFTDGGQSIGDILLEKAKTVRVRILVWYGGYVPSAVVYGQVDSGKDEAGSDYNIANLPGYDEHPGEKSKYVKSGQWYDKIKNEPNIEFKTRSMGSADVGTAALGGVQISGTVNAAGRAVTATHHQKMVLIDYLQPAQAVGFVMGSNTLQRYWDTSEHPLRHENRRIDYVDTQYVPAPIGATTIPTKVQASVYLQPWQDISSKVQGQLLFDLNVNFSRAWARAGGSALEAGRASLQPAAFKSDGRLPAQIVRTQPQEKDCGIWNAYAQNTRYAAQYIYFENQYFRLQELTSSIAEAAERAAKAGRKQSLYLFVVTNVPDDHGRLSTYQMLSVLGKSEQMPGTSKSMVAGAQAAAPLAATQGGDQAALQTVICTLMVSKDKTYLPIYVHSKLVIIDDNYYMLGSANLNKRSMTSDSEINVSVPDPATAGQLRTSLWAMHRGAGMTGSFADEFTKWNQLATWNLKWFTEKSKDLSGHLVLFNDDNPAVWIAYD
jgi:phosphatidylserine/phosphatidylglycerophosphate/cardiolipin synthase-like enzyme